MTILLISLAAGILFGALLALCDRMDSPNQSNPVSDPSRPPGASRGPSQANLNGLSRW